MYWDHNGIDRIVLGGTTGETLISYKVLYDGFLEDIWVFRVGDSFLGREKIQQSDIYENKFRHNMWVSNLSLLE